MKEIKGVRKKIVDIMTLIFGIGVFASLIISAFSFFGYVVAIIIGGDTATAICQFIYKTIYPVLFTGTSCIVLFGLVKMYIAGESELANKKKKKAE